MRQEITNKIASKIESVPERPDHPALPPGPSAASLDPSCSSSRLSLHPGKINVAVLQFKSLNLNICSIFSHGMYWYQGEWYPIFI